MLLIGQLRPNLCKGCRRLIGVVLGGLRIVLRIRDLLPLALHAGGVSLHIADRESGGGDHNDDRQIDKRAFDAHTHTAVPVHPERI